MKIFDKNILINAFDIKNVDEQKEQILKDFKESPEFFAKFVCKGLINYLVMDMLYAHKHGDTYIDSKDTIKLKLFTSFYHYILRIPIESFNKSLLGKDIEGLNQDMSLYKAIEILLEFFEELEMYEKCSDLLKYQAKLQSDTIHELITLA